MFVVEIDADKCEGCGECTESCPADILAMEGEKAVVTGDPTECLGCESCVSMCPSEAISLTEQ